MYDNNTLELICNSESYAKSAMQKWIVVYPDAKNKEFIEDFEDLGFNIIEADTKELIQYLKDQSYARGVDIKKYVYREYREKFPGNFVCNELKRSGVRRPVVDFFAGAEPQISDIMSNNVSRIAYFSSVLEVILSGNITLITGIPGCGKSTLLMQLAFSNELSGRKFWFNNIIKQEAERLIKLATKNTISSNEIFSFSLIKSIASALERFIDLQTICTSPEFKLLISSILSDEIFKNRFTYSKFNALSATTSLISSADAIDLIRENENISLLEIVFFVATNAVIQDRIKRYINDLLRFEEESLKINLLELFTLVNYTSYCGIPCSMDMMYFYFSDDIDSYTDILYALEKMNKIIVESSEDSVYKQDQNYMVMRSKLFSEKSLSLIENHMIAQVLNRFLDRVSTQIIYRYDIFKRRAYDADLTKRAFDVDSGIKFYEKILEINQSPYIRHQYALFLQRKNLYDPAWKQIDQAYTESRKKIFSIANTHAIILFEHKGSISKDKKFFNFLFQLNSYIYLIICFISPNSFCRFFNSLNVPRKIYSPDVKIISS